MLKLSFCGFSKLCDYSLGLLIKTKMVKMMFFAKKMLKTIRVSIKSAIFVIDKKERTNY